MENIANGLTNDCFCQREMSKRFYPIVSVLLVSLLILIYLTPSINAETFTQTSFGDLKKTCTNSTGSVCSSVATCNVTIKTPLNNSYIVNNRAMQNNNNGIFNYTLSPSITSILGNYNWDMFCCDGTQCGESHGDYFVTKTGVQLTQDKAFIYLGMLGILVFLFVVDLFSIFVMPTKNNTNDKGFIISINNLKYFRAVLVVFAWALLITIMFTSSNISFLYLESVMFGNILFNIYRVMMWLTIPMLFIWFLWIFSSIFEDKEMKRLIERGVDVGGSI